MPSFAFAARPKAGDGSAGMVDGAWVPPIGIPKPDFGIEETHYMYAGLVGNGIYYDAGNGPYTHYVDNSGTCTAYSNLAANNTFERGADYWNGIDGLNILVICLGADGSELHEGKCIRDSDSPDRDPSGSDSMLKIQGVGEYEAYQDISVNEDKGYSFSGTVKINAADSSKMRVEWLDSQENVLGTDVVPDYSGPADSSDWSIRLENLIAPKNSVTARIWLGAELSTGSVYFDDFYFYFRGNETEPLCSLPGIFAAGSVAEIHGGPYSDNTGGTKRIMVYGSADKPIFIRGEESRSEFTRNMVLMGHHAILENLYVSNGGLTIRIPGGHPYIYNNHSYLSIRNFEAEGSGIHAGSYAEHIVIYNNEIHHGGNYASVVENDVHGTTAGGYSHYVWVVDNHIHHMGGDSFQTGHGANQTSSHIYIGRNDMHDDGENAVDLKDVTDVIVSENVMHDYYQPDNPSADNVITVSHYGPSDHAFRGTIRAWFLFNEMYNAEAASQTGGGGPKDIYYIGNIIHDIQGPAFVGWSHGDVYFVGNTMYNVGAGIGDTGGSDIATIVDNIFGNLSNPIGSHITLSNTAHQANAIVSNNLFQNPMNINTGCDNCSEADPLFVDAANGNFRLASSDSRAVDSGGLSAVYAEFENLYGLDIAKDIDGRSRPFGNGWDIGAFEFQGSACVDMPRLLNFISQWRQGYASMPFIISRLASWKSGEGC